jgi:aspartyl-tRNA(Asn)/glutamyl-tRNA(Gln) amidotransferase subunit C
MAVDRATVSRIAALARIRLSEAELEPLANELSRILDWVEQLNEVDTSAAAPMASVVGSGLPMREDRVTDGACREAILANAPRTAPSGAKAGFFAVPKVIE